MSETNEFFNKNTVLIDDSGDTWKNKSLFGNGGKIHSIFNRQIDAILSNQQVESGYYYSRDNGVLKLDKNYVRKKANEYFDLQGMDDEIKEIYILSQMREDNRFSLISEKDNVINQNIGNIISFIKIGIIILEESIDYELMHFYIKEGFISISNIKESINDFLMNRAKMVYDRVLSPMKISYPNGKISTIKDYHDLDHDLLDEEKFILAYVMKNKLLSDSHIETLKEILKKGGDNEEYYYEMYYKDNLVELYLKKMGL